MWQNLSVSGLCQDHSHSDSRLCHENVLLFSLLSFEPLELNSHSLLLWYNLTLFLSYLLYLDTQIASVPLSLLLHLVTPSPSQSPSQYLTSFISHIHQLNNHLSTLLPPSLFFFFITHCSHHIHLYTQPPHNFPPCTTHQHWPILNTHITNHHRYPTPPSAFEHRLIDQHTITTKLCTRK